MKKRIKDVADLRVGYQFRGKVNPDPLGTVRVIQIKDINGDLRVRVADLVAVTIDRPDPYLTHAGDVLFLSRGHRPYAVVVPEVEANTIATGYFFILRANGRVVLPEYLAWSLNQPEFQNSLRPYKRGSNIPMFSRTDLEDLRIHVPPLEVQRRILRVNDLLDRERQLLATVQEKRGRLVRAVSLKLMTGELKIRGNPS